VTGSCPSEAINSSISRVRSISGNSHAQHHGISDRALHTDARHPTLSYEFPEPSDCP